MQPADEFMQGLGGDPQAREEQRHQLFEDNCVRRICSHSGIPLHVGRARQDAAAKFGQPYLTFLWFAQLQPRFPAKMIGSKLRHTSGTKVGWTDLFGRGFMKLPWVEEYVTWAEKLAIDTSQEAFTLVFNAPHADKAGTMVIYNHLSVSGLAVDPELRDTPETRIIRPWGRNKLVFVIESLTGYLNYLGRDWVQIDDAEY